MSLVDSFRALDFASQKRLLDSLASTANTDLGLALHDDPIMIARQHNDVRISLICALFAYGNAKQIVRFLSSLDFSLLDSANKPTTNEIPQTSASNTATTTPTNEISFDSKTAATAPIQTTTPNQKSPASEILPTNEIPQTSAIDTAPMPHYRFQSQRDVREIFRAFSRIDSASIRDVCERAYARSGSVVQAIWALIDVLYGLSDYRSRGYEFYLGKARGDGAYKRYNMFMRWMVRRDGLDMGLFEGILARDLIVPLDTHTHAIGRRMGLLERCVADLRAARELSAALAKYDPHDPIKYDFALYRIGQLGADSLAKLLP